MRTQVTALDGMRQTATPLSISTSMTTNSHQSRVQQGRRRVVPVSLTHSTGAAAADTAIGTGGTTDTTMLLLNSRKGQHSKAPAVTKQQQQQWRKVGLQVWLQMALNLSPSRQRFQRTWQCCRYSR
jgi:hypothetical protein